MRYNRRPALGQQWYLRSHQSADADAFAMSMGDKFVDKSI